MYGICSISKYNSSVSLSHDVHGVTVYNLIKTIKENLQVEFVRKLKKLKTFWIILGEDKHDRWGDVFVWIQFCTCSLLSDVLLGDCLEVLFDLVKKRWLTMWNIRQKQKQFPYLIHWIWKGAHSPLYSKHKVMNSIIHLDLIQVIIKPSL